MTGRHKTSEFKVYPNRGKDYYRVLLFDHAKDMYWVVREQRKVWGLSRIGRYNFGGLTQSYRVLAPAKTRHEIGLITLARPYSRRAGVVAHEMFHAALYYWLERWPVKLLAKSRYEEKVARSVGWMTAQYWEKWYKLNRRAITDRV